MARLYVSEFYEIGTDRKGTAGFPLVPAVREYSLEIGDESVQSEPFTKNTGFVVVIADEDCSVAWGGNPVATPEKGFLPAGSERSVSVRVGDRLAVIANEG